MQRLSTISLKLMYVKAKHGWVWVYGVSIEQWYSQQYTDDFSIRPLCQNLQGGLLWDVSSSEIIIDSLTQAMVQWYIS